MNNPDLDKTLGVYRQRKLPSVPANLSQNVWREIRLRQATSAPECGLDAFLAWFRASTSFLTATTLALALVISVGSAFWGHQPTNQEQVRQALGLNVFSHQASPLTRLAQNP